MNTRYNVFEVTCERKQATEVVSCLFHTILFHRTYGKFCYKHDSSYSIGTLGFEEVECATLDMTYVRCSSPSLKDMLNREIVEFSDRLRLLETHNPMIPCCGTINLEFYMKSARWKFGESPLTWEVWTIKLNCDKGALPNAPKVEEVLLEKILTIIQTVNSDKFLPPAPNQQQERNIFDVLHPDVQPYLFKVHHFVGPSRSGAPGSGGSGAVGVSGGGTGVGGGSGIGPSGLLPGAVGGGSGPGSGLSDGGKIVPSTIKQFLKDAFNF